jgi:2,5-diketo-D-gluconate reductase A
MSISQSTRNQIGMPLVGFGTYQLSDEQAEDCVKEAIQIGYRHIDTAEAYNNEEGVGRGIKASGIARDDLFVTTKVFPGYKQWGGEKNYDQVIETLKNQLTKLQLDYVDLYLIHAPLSELRVEQWKALEELKKQGLTKHIGVSNFSEINIKELQDAGLSTPEANQIELHPIHTQPELTKYMAANGIATIAYSSLAPLSSWRAEAGQGGDMVADIKADCQAVTSEIAERQNTSQAKLLLRWALQHGYAILPKSSKLERIKENFDLFGFEISDSDMERLDQLNQNKIIAWAASGINPMNDAPPAK